MKKRTKCAFARSRARSRDPGTRSGRTIWPAGFVLSFDAWFYRLNFKRQTHLELLRALKLIVRSTGLTVSLILLIAVFRVPVFSLLSRNVTPRELGCYFQVSGFSDSRDVFRFFGFSGRYPQRIGTFTCRILNLPIVFKQRSVS